MNLIVHNKGSVLLHHTRAREVGHVALRAVIFDYGMVLSNPPDAAAHAQLLRITGLSAEKLDPLYWADRHAFDEGKLTGETYWRGVLQKAGIALSPEAVAELMEWDARMWITPNPAMLSWATSLKARGILAAILSNIGDTVSKAIEREADWLSRFDLYVWSYQLRIAKPDPAIFRYTLDQLGARPDESLFIDDRVENVNAAIALGMQSLVFTTVERLRADLVAAGLDSYLPLPASA